MSKKQKRRDIDKIKFSIGAKLITIISIIVVISLGSITALVSWLVRQDLRLSAEDNNFEINRRSAIEAESELLKIRSSSRVLIRTLYKAGTKTDMEKDSVDFFFSENPQIAAVFYITQGSSEQLLVNSGFFTTTETGQSLAETFFDNQRDKISRAIRGETVIANAAPVFARPLLAVFFPFNYQDHEPSGAGVGAALFSTETLNNNFGFGVNQTFMINSEGDILAHSDLSVLMAGANIADDPYIVSVLSSADRNRQQLIQSDFGFSGEKELRDNQDEFSNDWNIIDKAKYNILHLWNKVWNKSRSLLNILFKKFKLNITLAETNENNRHFAAFTKISTANIVVITGIEYDKVFEGIAATTRRNLYLTIAVLSISIIFIWFFSKSISIPLRSLALAARQIEIGQFNLDLSAEKSRDEIGVLTGSFNKMSTALNIFGRFTNKEIAVKAMRGEIKPGGLQKHATVFFSDIRGFTAKSENFTKIFGNAASDKIVAWLNAYLTQMVDCVEKTNGIIDKFIGDAVMAHWGTAFSAGTPQEDAFNCVKAALMMRSALYSMNKDRRNNDPANPIIHIGCGINTGMVTAGQLGSDMRMEYTVIGDPVNLASRIESLTKVLGADILISEATWNMVGDKFITQEMPSVTVKGKEKPVRIFAVVNFKEILKGPRTLSEVQMLLGITPPDLEKVDVNADEKKYKINANG